MEPIQRSEHIKYGKAFIDYEIINIDGAEKVKVNFKDGSSDICDVLVGADGANSRVSCPNVRHSTHTEFVSRSTNSSA